MLEKLLFKKIELWVLLLLLIFGLIGTVLFSFTVWYGTKGAARYKGLTDTTIAIARSPMTIAKVIDRTILNTSDSELAQRFGDQAGLTFNTAPDPNAGYILVNRHDGDIKASVTELVDLASQEIVQRWVFDVDPIWRQTDFVSRLFDFRLIRAPRGFGPIRSS